jgi:hypothetical protein
MKRKMKKFNEGGKTYEKEDEGFFGSKINYREEDGRKYVAGTPNAMDRNPQEQRYYSVDDVKSKLSGLFGGKKEDSSSKFDELESVGGAGRRPRTIQEQISGKSEEAPIRKMTDSMTNKPKAADKTFLREEADIDYKPAKKVESKKTSPDAGFTKKDNRTTKDAGFTKKDNRTTKDEGFTKKERPKSVVFKPDVFEEEKEQAAPVVRKVIKETVAKESKKAADTTVPKAFDMKSGNKTVYGTTTTDVFKQNEERKRKAAADKEAKKAKSDEENREFRSRSLSPALKKGGTVKKMASGGMARSSASKRADGCAIRGKTRA